jgi:predicted nucleic acid-binding protein
VRLLIEPPSLILILADGADVALQMLRLAGARQLRARRVHDARHAAAAIVASIKSVFTYDADDWISFEEDGLRITGPVTTMARLGRS